MWLIPDIYPDVDDNDIFIDRKDAGQKLANELIGYKGENIEIYALPRGGVPVAYEVANVLETSFNVIISRKLSTPEHPEYAIGALSELDTVVFSPQAFEKLGAVYKQALEQELKAEQKELKRRVSEYRNNKPIANLEDKTVIVIDDGLATGMSATAAGKALRKKSPKELIFAAPVCSIEGKAALDEIYDDVVCYLTPRNLRSVSLYYDHFPQVEDEEVKSYLPKNEGI